MMNYRSNNIADQIKSTLSMADVAQRYGFAPNRAGFIPCPFHQGDHTPSLKIYDEIGRGFHCHACGAGTSVIDFAMRLFNLSYPQAIVRLNSDFGLGLTNDRPDPRELQRVRRERAERDRARKVFEAEYANKTETYRRLWFAKLTKAPKGPQHDLDPEYVEACQKLAQLDYYFDVTPFGSR